MGAITREYPTVMKSPVSFNIVFPYIIKQNLKITSMRVDIVYMNNIRLDFFKHFYKFFCGMLCLEAVITGYARIKSLQLYGQMI